MAWKKVEKAFNLDQREPDRVSVSCNGESVYAVFSRAQTAGSERCDVFHDGERVGLRFHDTGSHTVSKRAASKSTCQVSISAAVDKSRVPHGLNDVHAVWDGDMLVIYPYGSSKPKLRRPAARHVNGLHAAE